MDLLAGQQQGAGAMQASMSLELRVAVAPSSRKLPADGRADPKCRTPRLEHMLLCTFTATMVGTVVDAVTSPSR